MKPRRAYHKATLNERADASVLGGGRLGLVGTDVAQDGRVETQVRASVTVVGIRADPVVIDGLVSGHNDRVPLAGEDHEGVNFKLLVVDTVDLDNLAKYETRRRDKRCAT